jgi:hypothetical protein
MNPETNEIAHAAQPADEELLFLCPQQPVNGREQGTQQGIGNRE